MEVAQIKLYQGQTIQELEARVNVFLEENHIPYEQCTIKFYQNMGSMSDTLGRTGIVSLYTVKVKYSMQVEENKP